MPAHRARISETSVSVLLPLSLQNMRGGGLEARSLQIPLWAGDQLTTSNYPLRHRLYGLAPICLFSPQSHFHGSEESERFSSRFCPVLPSGLVLMDNADNFIVQEALECPRWTPKSALRQLEDLCFNVSPVFFSAVRIGKFIEIFCKFLFVLYKIRSLDTLYGT